MEGWLLTHFQQLDQKKLYSLFSRNDSICEVIKKGCIFLPSL